VRARDVLVAALVTATATAAIARTRKHEHRSHDDPAAESMPDDADPLRAYLRAQLLAQWDVAQRWRAADADKLADRAAARAHRARAAYELLRGADSAPWLDPDTRLAALRRQAAARHLLTIDRAEVGVLADELVHVDAGLVRLAAERAQAQALALPAPDLEWPADGIVSRHFGTFVHATSKATLSRHGIDLDVRAHAEAGAVADGVVRYAGPIRGLDNGVVVDHGAFTSVTAKLGDLAVKAGDHVSRGEPLGDAATHRLYLELRLPIGPGGLPIDPELLLDAHEARREQARDDEP
jgi:murein DD-endopeptidase MepM/ murein hydrolase activator NlpD